MSIFKPFDAKYSSVIVPLLPLRDIILFPHVVIPLFVGRDKSVKALEYAMGFDKSILLATQRSPKINDPAEKDIFSVGTIGTILQLLRLPDGTVKVLIEGKRRCRIKRFIDKDEFFFVEAEEVPEIRIGSLEMEALIRNVHSAFESYVKLNKRIPPEMIMSVSNIEDANRLSDTVASHLTVKIPEKQQLLEIVDPVERLEKLYGLLQAEIDILLVEKRIKTRVKKQMEKSQREYYLNEQMKAIQKELGEKDDFRSELAEIEEKIKNKKMSVEATKKVNAELKKLKMMSPMSAEATVIRNYIDWLVSIPWEERSETKLDIDEAERILEEDHHGLKNVKERILEYLSVQSLVGRVKGQILCLVGPPGVGKTSLAKSIARSTGRNFVRVSLGGVRDEAEIRGHRRTYIGALPGKIIQSMKKVSTKNPVFLLDEIDKMSSDFRGDPASALLEVLDPEQNHAFMDHYLDIDYDLSEVMFITTANTTHTIPPPLLDRMETIRLAGYTEIEKFHIARKYLIKKQMDASGLSPETISFTDRSIYSIIRYYTREAGVRNLEREIASVCRKVAKEVLKKGKEIKIEINGRNIQKYLGVQKYRYGEREEKSEPGLTTGLAWTESGGELLITEATVMPGKGNLTITGKLGDVMQESAQAALSYVRARAARLGIDINFYQKVDIHIHVPEGAIPKDGPSAGITMATAIVSALTRWPVRNDLAMTGEITLRGRVLPIGGLKEKLLAAHRGKINTVIIPKENEKDLKDVPSKVLKALDLILVDHMDEVLKNSLILGEKDTLLKDIDEKEQASFIENLAYKEYAH